MTLLRISGFRNLLQSPRSGVPVMIMPTVPLSLTQMIMSLSSGFPVSDAGGSLEDLPNGFARFCS